MPGAPWNEPSLLVGEGGTIYQTTYTFNGGYTSYISAINPSTPADFTTITVHDAAFNIRVAPDGHVYHTTQDYHAELGDYVTHVTVIDFNDPANPAPPVEIPGYPESSGVVLGPDGTAYQTTQSGSAGNHITHVTVIDPDDPAHAVTLHIPGETYGFGGPLIGADGNVYQATRTATTGTSPIFPPITTTSSQ